MLAEDNEQPDCLNHPSEWTSFANLSHSSKEVRAVDLPQKGLGESALMRGASMYLFQFTLNPWKF
jgi:hypothetical protein